MPNPIKGEIDIEISGTKYPLVFSYAAIAEIETLYNEPLASVQEDMSRVDKILDLLVAGLGGKFTKKVLMKEKLPPVLITAGLISQALQMAYWGDVIADKEPKKKPKKKNPKKK